MYIRYESFINPFPTLVSLGRPARQMYEKHVRIACGAAARGSVDVVWVCTNDNQPLVGRLDAQPVPADTTIGSPEQRSY